MFFKDRLFNNLNETDELSIVDIEVNDANEKMIIMADHTQFMINIAPYDSF
jgi:hypothetical protein